MQNKLLGVLGLGLWIATGCGSSTTAPPADSGAPDGAATPLDGALPDGAVVDGGGGDAQVTFAARLDAAAASWAATKPACGAYRYDRSTISVFGSATRTTIEIAGDHPIRRDYVVYVSDRLVDGGQRILQEWHETGAAIGMHDGFPARTVEELIAECRMILARDPATNDLTLKIAPNGVPTTCTYYPKGCADDCTQGIEISSFECAARAVDGGPDGP